MTYNFLLLDIFLLFLPFLLMLDRKFFRFEKLKTAIVPSLIVTILFSEIAVFFAGAKVITFNPNYLLGSFYRGLPAEEYLFVFAFSFAGLGIYNYLNSRFPKNDLQKYSLAVSNLLLGVCVAMLFFAYTKWYTALTFSVLFLLIIGIEYVNQLRFMYHFYRAFVFCLIPFYISYGLICNLPITNYNPTENLDVSIAHIPLETHFLMMASLLFGVYLVEFFKNRTAK